MHDSISSLFDGLWRDYLSITPSAKNIHRLLLEKTNSDSIVNDHIALRTFDLDKTKLSHLAKHFEHLGYEAKGDYDFKAKKLSAKHFEHADPTAPKVFISQLRVSELSQNAQEIIHRLVAEMDNVAVDNENFLYSGAHWRVSSSDYKSLMAESEYAAWMAAWGFRANHFTVSVNHLKHFQELETVNDTLKQAGFVLNSSGGEIKGGPEVHLAQSSTMADSFEKEFSDLSLNIPSCFYEFAQRYEMKNGQLYQGFVEASADKIFESTHAS